MFFVWRRSSQKEKRKKNETVFGWCFSTELLSCANTRRLARERATEGGGGSEAAMRSPRLACFQLKTPWSIIDI